jgi:hypothetical protein
MVMPKKPSFAVVKATDGCSPAQRALIAAHIETMRKRGMTLEGWSIYRMPTTIHPPTTLRLHHRNALGKLMQVISITEDGVNKTHIVK